MQYSSIDRRSEQPRSLQFRRFALGDRAAISGGWHDDCHLARGCQQRMSNGKQQVQLNPYNLSQHMVTIDLITIGNKN